MSYTAKLFLCVLVLFHGLAFCREALLATASGKVILNGKALMRSSAVFTGDKLQTGSASALTLQAKRFSVQVGPVATVIVEDNALSVESGSVRASGLVDVQTGSITIFSDSADTKFDVVRSGGTVEVKVLTGSTIVRGSKERTLMRRGESRTFQESDTTPAAKKKSHKKFATAAGAVGVASAGAIIALHLGDRKHDNCCNRAPNSAK